MKRIGIAGAAISAGQRRTLAALETLFAVRIEEGASDEDHQIEAWVFHGLSREDTVRTLNRDCACYVICGDQQSACTDSDLVSFVKHPAVSAVFAGRTIRSKEAIRLRGLPPWLRDLAPLAWKDNAPIWALGASAAGHSHHFVALTIPELAEDEPIYHHFSGNEFLTLLPLLTFLREVTEDRRWEGPAIQACFMFDDPNLHWPTYGYVDFARMARHAAIHDYHISFATIPLDSWFVHEPTAAVFRNSCKVMSLLMHGNDHIHEELAGALSSQECVLALEQALDRVEVMERRSNVEISRVMAPPHGACTEETLTQMALIGYEAACISNGSLRRYNPGAAWVRTVGMKACEAIGGLPVFPRFRVSRTCQNAILVAAFLRQPIIAVGHHQDVADGLEMFSDLAHYINSMGNVRWGNMTTIARSHYARRIDGKALRVRMHTKRAEVLIQDGVEQIAVERLSVQADADDSLFLVASGTEHGAVKIDWEEPVAVRPGQQISLISRAASRSPRQSAGRRTLRPWPVVRRVMTEARDRLTPTLRHVFRRPV